METALHPYLKWVQYKPQTKDSIQLFTFTKYDDLTPQETIITVYILK